MVRRFFGQAQRQRGAAQVVSVSDMNKPVLLLSVLCHKAPEPGRVQKGGNVVARQQMTCQTPELSAGFLHSRLATLRRSFCHSS